MKKFNGMDLFIIICLVLAIGAGAYLLLGRGETGAVSDAKNVKVSVTVEFAAQDEQFAKTPQIGDIAMIGEKSKMRTIVSDVKTPTAMATGYDTLNGQVFYSEMNGDYDVQVTMTAEGTETSKDITVDGLAVRVGEKVVVSGKNFAGEGYVIGLETEEL